MATEGTTRPDEPLRQYPEDKSAPSQVGTHQVQNADDDSQPTVAVDEYQVPGTANPDPEGAEAVEEYENEPQAETQANVNRTLIADTRSPEANYLTRDNIVLPDPRPEEAARVERFARASIADVQTAPDELTVQQDATDVAEQLRREGNYDGDTPALEQAAERRDKEAEARKDVDPLSEGATGPGPV